MKTTLRFIFEILLLIIIMFFVLFLYSLINTMILEAVGGFEIFEGTIFLTLFFLLQTGGLLVIMTVFYRNKLQFFGWYKGDHLKPIPRKASRRLIIVSIISMMSSYLILIFRLITM